MKRSSVEHEASQGTCPLRLPGDDSTLSVSAETEMPLRQVRMAEIRSRLELGSYRIGSDQIAAKLVDRMLQKGLEPVSQRNSLDRQRSEDA